VDPTVKKILTGIGLTAGYHAGNITQDALNNSFFDRAQRETGTVKDPEKESILTAHLETTKDKPTITTDAPIHGSGYISQYGAKELGNAKYADEVTLEKDASRFVLAHELGHREARFGKNPIERTAQNNLYQGISPLIKAPALFAIGYATPSSRRALAYGLAANYLNYTPMLIAENAANRHAQKYMQETGQPVDKSIPREQLRNYGVGIGVDAIGQVGAGVLIKGLAENPHTRDFTRAILHLDEVEKGAKVAKDVSKEAFNYLRHKARDLW
jgi:pyruvoyl-dependent arginine decarboxylase (PvlArgDC)